MRPALAISFESAAIILSVALWVALVGAMRAGARITLAATVVLLVLLRYLDVTSAGLLGRPVDLYWEARHAPRLLAMGLDALSGWSVIAIGGGAIFAVVALGVGAYHLCNAIVRSVEHAPARRAAIAGAAVVLALHVVGAIYGDRRSARRWWRALRINCARLFHRRARSAPTTRPWRRRQFRARAAT